MLGDLHRFNEQSSAAIMVALDSRTSLGKPKGQQRMFDRVIKAMGPTYLQGWLTTGKKAQFQFTYTTFIAHEAEGLFITSVSFGKKRNER
jgi:hypothetical protein